MYACFPGGSKDCDKQWQQTMIDFHYSSADLRKVLSLLMYMICNNCSLQLIVFTKISSSVQDYPTINLHKQIAIRKAYCKANKVFGKINLVGGTHKLPKTATLTLIDTIQVHTGDISWEIGCGSLELAFSLSCAANGGRVVAMDLSEFVSNIFTGLK